MEKDITDFTSKEELMEYLETTFPTKVAESFCDSEKVIKDNCPSCERLLQPDRSENIGVHNLRGCKCMAGYIGPCEGHE